MFAVNVWVLGVATFVSEVGANVNQFAAGAGRDAGDLHMEVGDVGVERVVDQR